MNWDDLRVARILQHWPRPKIIVWKYELKTVLLKLECNMCWYCLQCKFIWTSERISSMALEAWAQYILYPRAHATYWSLEPMNLQMSIMKYILPPLKFSSLHQISRHLRYVNPVNWIILSTACLNFKHSTKASQNHEGTLSHADQSVVNTPDRLSSGYGREVPHNRYYSGTLFHGAATSLNWAVNQVWLGAGETLLTKEHSEQWSLDLAAANSHHLHSDNGIFNATCFVGDCKNTFQTQSFSGVGVHHQNALDERSIQTIMYMNHTFIVHASLHLFLCGSDNLTLWGFALKHAVWLHNHILNHWSV